MDIGYACLTLGVFHTDLKSCLRKNADEKRLIELIGHNLNSLERMIDYNRANRIRLFRISSDLIPFGSSEVNRLEWQEQFQAQLTQIARKIKEGQIRVSMHPGQYTVLNSPNRDVVHRAIEDLSYHNRVLDSLNSGPECKIVLHLGGIYQNKTEALKRFAAHYCLLDDSIKKRIVIENDDKLFNITDVLETGTKLGIPVVFDNLHHQVNPGSESREEREWIDLCERTWTERDGRQKIHYSQQNPQKRQGAHSETIRVDEFMKFYDSLNTDQIDMMLEVKDKNLSAVKCRNLVSERKEIKELEREWSRYKYAVLEHSQAAYLNVRKLIQNKKDYPVVPFYWFIEDALGKDFDAGQSINAAQHIWGYFGKKATEKERKQFLRCLDGYSTNPDMQKKMKRFLWRMAVKYREEYLLNSYYFIV